MRDTIFLKLSVTDLPSNEGKQKVKVAVMEDGKVIAFSRQVPAGQEESSDRKRHERTVAVVSVLQAVIIHTDEPCPDMPGTVPTIYYGNARPPAQKEAVKKVVELWQRHKMLTASLIEKSFRASVLSSVPPFSALTL